MLLSCNSQRDDDKVNISDSNNLLDKSGKIKQPNSSLSIKYFGQQFLCGGGVPISTNGQYTHQTYFNRYNPDLQFSRGRIISDVLIGEISDNFSIYETFFPQDDSWSAPFAYNQFSPNAPEFSFEFIDSTMPSYSFPYSGEMPAAVVQGLIDNSLVRVQDFKDQHPTYTLIAITAHPNGYLCTDPNRGVAIKIKYLIN
jgi:hypothetical protein